MSEVYEGDNLLKDVRSCKLLLSSDMKLLT